MSNQEIAARARAVADDIDKLAAASRDGVTCRFFKLAAYVCRSASARIDPDAAVPETYPWERNRG